MLLGKQGLFEEILTGSKYLGEDALLVSAVNVVGCLSFLVGPVEQTTIFRVPQEELSEFATSTTNGNMQSCVTFLRNIIIFLENIEMQKFTILNSSV